VLLLGCLSLWQLPAKEAAEVGLGWQLTSSPELLLLASLLLLLLLLLYLLPAPPDFCVVLLCQCLPPQMVR
jgi:hypothetical protein